MYAPLQKQNKAAAKTSSQSLARTNRQQANQPEHLTKPKENQAITKTAHASPGGAGVRPTGGGNHFHYNFADIPVFHRPVRGIQAKLTVNVPGDAYEQEADRVAEQVMRMPDPQVAPMSQASGHAAGVQRECACGGSCDDCKKKNHDEDHAKVQMKAAGPMNAGDVEAPPIVHEVLRSSGQPLDALTRAFMEPRFGHDFSKVRVHTDERAAESARAVGARAYTVGSNVVFGAGEYGPRTARGAHLLAHELSHTIQQSYSEAPASQQLTDYGSEARSPLLQFIPSVYGSLQREKRGRHMTKFERLECIFFVPMPFSQFCFLDEMEDDKFGSGSPAPAGPYNLPSPPPPHMPPPPSKGTKKLNFFHGTRWSIAKTIPNNVKPIGGGDFAAGFYTHQDRDDSKALGRAVKWGRAMANKKPSEAYAGVVRFGVQETDYNQLYAGNKGKDFGLDRIDQPDFKDKQKAWLDFITSTGRVQSPTFNSQREQWIHGRRDPQPSLPYNIIKGPFYTPLKGTKENKPKPEEFKPFAEGQHLPQQVSWANDGIALLNSNKVEKELKQFDAKTGNLQDPPINATASQLSDKQVNDATENAQLDAFNKLP